MTDACNQHHQSSVDDDVARQTHMRQIAVLTEIARATTRATDLREMFVVVSDSVRTLIDFDGLTLGIVSGPGRVEGLHAAGDEIEPLDLDDPALVSWVRSVQRVVVYSDDNVPNEHIRALLRHGNFKHLLQAPLIVDGESIGVLAALRHGGQGFDTAEVTLMESVGDFVAVAARNSRLLQDAERARWEAEQRLEQLASLDRVTQRLATEASLDQALAVIGDELARLLPFVSCQIWELSPGRDQLVAIQTWGASANTRPRPMLAAGEGIIGDVVASRRPAFVPDATADPRSRYPAEFEDLRRQLLEVGESVMAAPLIAAGAVLGGLLMSRAGRGQFSADDFRLFVSFAGQIALALRGVRMAEENRELFLSTIRSLASLVDQRETGGHPHSDRVAFLSEAIAIEMQLPPYEIEQVRIAATIHDAGKIGIPEALLVKTDPLTAEERALLMTHPALAASMVQAHGTHPDVVPLIRHHHEWYDGSGYPDELAGDAIPPGAAIICVAEAFERITSDLPYQAARSTAAAKQLLAAGSGQQFHPNVVEAALRVITSFEESAAPYLSRVPEAIADAQPSRLTLVEMQQREDQPPGTFRILYEIAHEIGAIPELTRFLRQIAQIIGAEMSVAGCTIFLLERDSGNLIAAGAYPDNGELARISPADGPLVAAVRAGQPQTLPSDDADGGRYMVPLINDGAPIGAIVVEAGSGLRFRDSERRILGAIAGQIATAIGVAQQHDDARRGAITDGMTGSHNYRYFMERFDLALERYAPVSLMLIDIDSLKRLNDVSGHLAGDALLRAVAVSLAAGVRRSDVVARYGGDEFVVLMPQTPRDEALVIAARLAADLERLPEAQLAGRAHMHVASYGVSASPDDGTTPAALLEAADKAMYAMKRARGNQRSNPR